ncbi:MAG: hypothetical protein AB1529_06720 [Candidatus Micrarchaeota archaeon]
MRMKRHINGEKAGGSRGLHAVPFAGAAALLALQVCVYESPGIPLSGHDSLTPDKAKDARAETKAKDIAQDYLSDRSRDVKPQADMPAKQDIRADLKADAKKPDSMQKDMSKDMKQPSDMPKDVKAAMDLSKDAKGPADTFSPLCKGVFNASVTSGSFPKGTDTGLGGYLLNYVSYTTSTVTMDVKCGSDNSPVAAGEVFTVGVEKTIQVPKDGKKIRITVLNKNTFNATCTVYVENI